jgi:hypothetical protein
LLIFDGLKILSPSGWLLGGTPWKTSLVLTNRRFYRILKSLYPDPIYADPMYDPTHTISKQQQTLVKASLMFMSPKIEAVVGSFLGPDYHPSVLRHACPPPSSIAFLKRSVYGDRYSLQEEQLGDRSIDAMNHAELCRPFGMREEWYAHAIEVIRNRRLFSTPMSFSASYVISYEKTMEMHGSICDKLAGWRDRIDWTADARQ